VIVASIEDEMHRAVSKTMRIAMKGKKNVRTKLIKYDIIE
jgi:hypothetical protein